MDEAREVPEAAAVWAARMAAFDEVEAVALGGSWKTGSADDRSDLDPRCTAARRPLRRRDAA